MEVQDWRMQGFTEIVSNQLVCMQYSPRIWIVSYISIVIPTENLHGCTNFYTPILARTCTCTLTNHNKVNKLYKFKGKSVASKSSTKKSYN